MDLRPYQLEALDAIQTAVSDGPQRFMVELPTASGKTLIFAAWIADILKQRDARVLILVREDVLVSQTIQKLQQAGVPHGAIGVVKAARDEHARPVVIGSVQTLLLPHRLQRIGSFTHIIIDEAHHTAARSYVDILDYLRPPIVAGFTATAYRATAAQTAKLVGEHGVFSKVIFTRSIRWMISNEYLCDVRGYRFELDGLDLDTVRRVVGDFNDSDLSSAMLAADAIPQIVKGYEDTLVRFPECAGPMIAFCPDIAFAQALAVKFSDLVPAEYYAGDHLKDGVREDIRERFERGEIRLLTACTSLTEGYDFDQLRGVLLCRPTTSPVLFRQIIGRALRRADNKPHALVLDFSGATRKHNLARLATVFQTDPDGLELLEGESFREAGVRQQVKDTHRTASREELARQIAVAIDLFKDAQQIHLDENVTAATVWLGYAVGTVDIACMAPNDPERRTASTWAVFRFRDASNYSPAMETVIGEALTLPAARERLTQLAQEKHVERYLKLALNLKLASRKQRQMYLDIEHQPMPAEWTVSDANRFLGPRAARGRHKARLRYRGTL